MMPLMMYYIFSSAVVFFYGIGINSFIAPEKNANSLLLQAGRSLVTSFSSVCIVCFISRFMLIPLKLTELFPLAAISVFIGVNFLLNFIMPSETESDTYDDYAVPLLTVILSTSEGLDIVSCLLICTSCIITSYLFLLLIISYKRRFELFSDSRGFKLCGLILLALAATVLSISAWNASWLSAGI